MTVAVSVVALTAAAAAGWYAARRRSAPQPAVVVPSALPRHSIITAIQNTEDSEDARRDDASLVTNVLRMVADQHGASTAMFWHVGDADTEQPYAIAWNREGPPTSAGIAGRETELIRWAATNRVIMFDRPDGAPQFVAAPATVGDATGALVLLFNGEASASREMLRHWLPRHGRRIAALRELLRTRAESAKMNLRLRATLRAAIEMQGTKDPAELESFFARVSLDVAGAEWSVLVRWDQAAGAGELRAVSEGDLIPPGLTQVHRDTLLGDVCVDGAPLVYEDARSFIADGRALIDGAPVPRRTGSLILVPVRRGVDERPIGAIACGHRTPGAMTVQDARDIRELAIIAGSSLATAWAVEDARASARVDGLTGLANRRAFEELFGKAVEWTDRQEGALMALVMADIDFFKKVNDTYGHDAGDRVLQAVASALTKDRRAVDSVARLGGEEFALILPSITEHGAREVAERLRARVEALRVNTHAGEVRVTASFGVALYKARGGDAAKLFERADQSLYAAKRGGRNRVEQG